LVSATLDFRSEEGVDTDAELARQMLDHVNRGYGTAVAAGERDVRGENVETVWTSDLGGESIVTRAPADPATGEVSEEYLIIELRTLEVDEEI
jgi:hypothetical protein